jgi:hypothetical protein
MRTEEQTGQREGVGRERKREKERERDDEANTLFSKFFSKAPLKTQKLINAPQLCSGGLWYQRC